jgi:predicted alpha-1,2-mannosidase
MLPLTPCVNLFIGSAPAPGVKGGFKAVAGNTFPGAVLPRGMVAWSPDTTQYKQAPSGYWYPDQTIAGFSLTHFSGRGMMYLLDVPFMPVVQPVNLSPGTDWDHYAAGFSHANEMASPGYYSVTLDTGVKTELTATLRTGMARFTFPAHAPAALLIRAGDSVSISNNEVAGYCTDKISGGKWSFTIYFVAEFDHQIQSGKTWLGANIRDDANASGKNCGAILTFDTAANSVVQARVGISYVSRENARANLASENSVWKFDLLRSNADQAWNDALNLVQVEGGTSEQRQTFYTSLYHCFMHPNLLDDVNGQYPGMDEKIHTVAAGHHQYQNIPAWDQYRSLEPLVAVLTPSVSSDIMQSLVNYAQQDASVRPDGGGLPRWEQANANSGGMVGDGDDAIIASAYAFGATNFDTTGALAAMDKGASHPGTTSDGFEVRGGLDDYLKLGYVPGRVSVTLEYCNADFALAQFANALGDHQKYVAYQNRAQNWKNLFDDSTGFLHPKTVDGRWSENFFTSNKTGFVEGTPSQYVWMVNFNLGGLIGKMGGQDKATARLDEFFTTLNSGMSGVTAYMGNEPCEGTPWIFDFADAPAHAQKVIRRIQQELFTTLPSGLPGNDDAGALSSWHVFSMLGLYPEIPGVAGFAIGSPAFPKATIRPEGGAPVQILGRQTSPENCCVQSLKLNDQSYDKLWLPWSDLAHGATLTFNLGPAPSAWGTGADAAPPSFDSIKQ